MNIIRSFSSVFRNQHVTRVLSSSMRFQSTQVAEPEEKKEEKAPTHISNVPGLCEFFDDEKNWGAEAVKTGRSWTKDELRIKSNSDLHKLWFVLLKERNMLLTWEQAAKDELETMPSPERVDKVNISMSNLEEVVRERNRAYYELEVGTTGERVTEERQTSLGLVSRVRQTEHWMPRRYNKSYNRVNPLPMNDKLQDWFLSHYRELRIRDKVRMSRRNRREVTQLLREFPDVDRDALQEKYPDVDVQQIENFVKEKYV